MRGRGWREEREVHGRGEGVREERESVRERKCLGLVNRALWIIIGPDLFTKADMYNANTSENGSIN